MYCVDRRKIAIHIYSLIHSLRKTATLLQVSHTSISRWTKSIERKQYYIKNPQHQKSKIIIEVVRSAIASNPFTTAAKLREVIKSTTSIAVSKELVRTVIGKLGLTRKKARFYGMTKALPEQTRDFLKQRNAFMEENRHIVSIDETAFGRNGIVINGYSPKGTPLCVRKKAPRVTTISVVACVSSQGLVKRKQLEGAFNTVEFFSFLESLDLPLRTVVLLDNVRFHHAKVVKQFAIEKRWDLLYVPPYSPWFNPIELCFSIIKRKFYECGDVSQSFDHLTEQHCNAFFGKSLTTNGGPV